VKSGELSSILGVGKIVLFAGASRSTPGAYLDYCSAATQVIRKAPFSFKKKTG
jgi:hypothetical protein